MTEAMPFLRKLILLSYDPRPCARGLFLVPAAALCYNTGIFLQRHCPLPVEH